MTSPSSTAPRQSFAPDADAQVSGGNILSMLAAMGAFRRRGEQILAGCGITDVELTGWYPLGAYVKALNLIEETVGPNTLHRIGQEIPNHIPLPPGLDTFEAVIGCFGPAFEMNHRGAGAGGITFKITGHREGVIVAGTPYPCDFNRGVIRGFFAKLLKSRTTVEHDPTKPCKKTGGASCTYTVKAS